MPMSPYVSAIRRRIGHDLVFLPSVGAAVFDPAGRVLLARHLDDDLWGTVGGGMEPGESPVDAVLREVAEETGLVVVIDALIGVYGGPEFEITYANGDRVSFVSTFYGAHAVAPEPARAADPDEIADVGWFSLPDALALPRRPWTDRTLPDAFAWWAGAGHRACADG